MIASNLCCQLNPVGKCSQCRTAWCFDHFRSEATHWSDNSLDAHKIDCPVAKEPWDNMFDFPGYNDEDEDEEIKF